MRRRGGVARRRRPRTAARAAGSTAASSQRSSTCQASRKSWQRRPERGPAVDESIVVEPGSASMNWTAIARAQAATIAETTTTGPRRPRGLRRPRWPSSRSRSLRVDELPVGLDRIATFERPDIVVLGQVHPQMVGLRHVRRRARHRGEERIPQSGGRAVRRRVRVHVTRDDLADPQGASAVPNLVHDRGPLDVEDLSVQAGKVRQAVRRACPRTRRGSRRAARPTPRR